MRVKGFRLLVLGVDHKRENPYFRTQGALKGIPQQSAPEFLPAISLIDRQAAEPCNGHQGLSER